MICTDTIPLQVPAKLKQYVTTLKTKSKFPFRGYLKCYFLMSLTSKNMGELKQHLSVTDRK